MHTYVHTCSEKVCAQAAHTRAQTAHVEAHPPQQRKHAGAWHWSCGKPASTRARHPAHAPQVDLHELAQLPQALQQEVMRELKPRAQRPPARRPAGPRPAGPLTAHSKGGDPRGVGGPGAPQRGAEADPVDAQGSGMGVVDGAAGKGQVQGQGRAAGEGSCAHKRAPGVGADAVGAPPNTLPWAPLMALPPAAVRRDFSDYVRACAVLLSRRPWGSRSGEGGRAGHEGRGGHPTASAEDRSGHLANLAAAAKARGSQHTGQSGEQAMQGGSQHSGQGGEQATQGGTGRGGMAEQPPECPDDAQRAEQELRSACALMQGWALAHCGNLEETGKTVGVLHGLCGTAGLPVVVEDVVQGVLHSVQQAVHAGYGVQLLPL